MYCGGLSDSPILMKANPQCIHACEIHNMLVQPCLSSSTNLAHSKAAEDVCVGSIVTENSKGYRAKGRLEKLRIYISLYFS